MARVGGTVKEGDLSAGAMFAKRLREVRTARGLTHSALATRIAERGGVGLGDPMHRVRLGKLEVDPEKARRVRLEEVLAIAYSLDVSPLFMLTSLGREPRLIVAGELQPVDPEEARSWLRGESPLLDQNRDVFVLERPLAEWVAKIADPEYLDVADHLDKLDRSALYQKETR